MKLGQRPINRCLAGELLAYMNTTPRTPEAICRRVKHLHKIEKKVMAENQKAQEAYVQKIRGR
jgi:hypothetical protein